MQTDLSHPRRIDSLHAVRALAFLGILTYHCGTVEAGPCCVSVFFVLSGFLMVYAYSGRELPCSARDSIAFAVRKIKKLYPLHIVMLFASIPVMLVTGKLVTTSADGMLLRTSAVLLRNLGFFSAQALLIQSWIPSHDLLYSFNAISWYLSASMFLYAMFPLILRTIRRFFTARRAVVSALAVYAVQIVLGFAAGNLNVPVYSFSHWFTYICPLFRLGDFFIGCCLGYLFLHRKSVPKKLPATLMELASLAVIVLSVILFTRRPYPIGADCFRLTLLNTPSSVLLIWAFATGTGALSGLLTCRPVLYLGRISPYGYLIHVVLMLALEYLLGLWSIEVGPWIETLLVLSLTVVASQMYMQIEKTMRGRGTGSGE